MKKTWARTAAIVSAIAVGAALFAPGGAGAQEPAEPDTVSVGARGMVEIEPDIAILTLGTRSKGATTKEALDLLSERTGRVLQALRSAGFSDDELSTENVRLDRACIARCRSKTDRQFGYRGSAAVRLETRSIDRIGEAIDIGIGAGANSIRGVRFDVEDKTAAVNQALQKAMNVARSKAETLAASGERTLGAAIRIIEGEAREPRAFAFDSAYLAGAAAGTSDSGSTSNPFPIEPPTLEATARVDVTYRLQ